MDFNIISIIICSCGVHPQLFHHHPICCDYSQGRTEVDCSASSAQLRRWPTAGCSLYTIFTLPSHWREQAKSLWTPLTLVRTFKMLPSGGRLRSTRIRIWASCPVQSVSSTKTSLPLSSKRHNIGNWACNLCTIWAYFLLGPYYLFNICASLMGQLSWHAMRVITINTSL